jgi:periodic tryptophan protein 1
LAVYVYDEVNSSLYVHHDIFLSSAPLCIEWLPYIPGSMSDQVNCNLAIVGTMSNSDIEIWDLDVLNCIEPKYMLKDEHSDSIMCLNLNSMRKYNHN